MAARAVPALLASAGSSTSTAGTAVSLDLVYGLRGPHRRTLPSRQLDGIALHAGPLAVEDSECQYPARRSKTEGDRVPTYQYVCNDCGESLEAVQKFSDDALTVCPSCDARLRKIYSAVGVVFKGSGFYRNDS